MDSERGRSDMEHTLDARLGSVEIDGGGKRRLVLRWSGEGKVFGPVLVKSRGRTRKQADAELKCQAVRWLKARMREIG